MSRHHAAPRVLVAIGLALLSCTWGGPLPSALAAGEPPASVTTPSARTVSWVDQPPRNPADGPTSTAYARLKDWKLRVSQSKELLNQTVEVSWSGVPELLSGRFVQLMQCWSDGPTVSPTREQCAHGGVDPVGTEGFGAAKNRQLGPDPREQVYRLGGDLVVRFVDGANPPASWPETAKISFSTFTSAKACPTATTGYTVSVIPPRGGSALPTLTTEGPTLTPPPSATIMNGTSSQTFNNVTAPFSFSELAGRGGVTSWPLGSYRIELSCNVAGEQIPPVRFVGFVDKTRTAAGAEVWRRSAHAGGISVPFDPVGDGVDLAPTDPFERDQIFDYLQPRTTNEIGVAESRPDGSGQTFMEVLTDLEAQHLGCGRLTSTGPRSCFLVAIPRWAGEPEGGENGGGDQSSPMSQTHWDRRIEVPLQFAPVAAGCRIGSGLKQVLAHDSALSVLRSWQPTFCSSTSTASSVIGPLQDDAVRGSVNGPNRLGVVTLPPEGDSALVTAPLTTSGVVVAFVADRQLPPPSPKYAALNGTRANVLNLNARLLAKLLTQSYDSGASPNGGKLEGFNSGGLVGGVKPVFTPARNFPAGNPRRLYDDPEFLGLNPDFADWLKEGGSLSPEDMADVLMSANSMDAYNVLWRWLLGDPEARAFLGGAPDPSGMVVNPHFKGQINAETSNFPVLDPTCVDNIGDPAGDAFPLLCGLNNHPRAENDKDAAQAAIRGDTKRVNLPPTVFTGEVLTYKAQARQNPGTQAMLAITTTAVAARYGLPTARLKNASGTFVPAGNDNLAAARDQMTRRADGVLLPDPAKVGGTGYPLTTMSYAMVDSVAATPAQALAFATILDYAAGQGQVSGTGLGQLPPGYAPLSATLRSQTRAAATALRTSAAPAVEGVPDPTPSKPVGDLPPTLQGQQIPPLAGSGPVLPTTVGSEQPAPVVAASGAKDLAASVSLTGRVQATLPWLVPGLLCLAVAALLASRLLRLPGGAPSSRS